ncbi:MAG TPA: hydrogen gas-evolving membrane-bound hydrogenase subunit E, partial [Thermomicrobiales bacterium]|nr:hydrogen gas-evolving membrane-bound hydrogenase subunit E [Thermomicrobiales bacterium]
GAMFYIFAHALVKSALFMSAGAVTEATGSKYMSKTGGLWRDMPWLAVGSGLAAAGLVALPLTIGFFKDELFFASAWERSTGFGVLAVMAASFTFAYVGRFWKGIFLGQRRTAPRPVSAMLVVPIVVLGVLTVLFGVWTPWVVAIAEQAATIDGADPAHIDVGYHLDLRAENVMAVLAWGLGISIIVTERWWRETALTISRLGEIFGPERIYWSSLRNLERLSDWIHRIEVRDLRSRVATILAPTGLLVGIAAVVTPNSNAFEVGSFERGDLPLVTMLVATTLAAIAVAIPRGHLRIVLTLSCVGFSLAVIYALLGAPDVALVAVLVETVLGIFFVAMLLLMPRSILRFETREPTEQSGVRRDVILAVASAAMAFVVVWGILSRPSGSNQLINSYDRLTPVAHGKDIVTVILADFRGFDTLGEITVISLVALGVLGLIRKGRLR